VYDKTLDLQEEYELAQKAKSAIDTTLTVADNLNRNYQITAKVDEKLQLSAAVDKALASVDDLKASVTSTADDVKSKARSGAPRMAVEEEPEPTPKAIAIGAAAGAGLLGIQLTGDLTTGAVLAIVCAYGTTLSNVFGSATKTLGSACTKVYDKTLDLQEEYELAQKAKSAIDTTLTVADNLNRNYQITAKVDEKLQLSAAVDKALASVDDLKASVTSTADDVKSKARSATPRMLVPAGPEDPQTTLADASVIAMEDPIARRELLSKVLLASTMLGAAAANAEIDYPGVGYLGGDSIIDVNNANIRVYQRLPGMYPSAAGKIVSNAPYKSKEDMYAKAKLSPAEAAATKKYESKFIFLEPRPEYIIDNINNGLYK